MRLFSLLTGFFLLMFSLILSPLVAEEEPSLPNNTTSVHSSPVANNALTETVTLDSEKHPLVSESSPSRRGTVSTQGLFRGVLNLVLVLTLLGGILYFLRRRGVQGTATPPESLYQSLGEFPIAPRMRGKIVRFGPKLLLLGISPSGVEKIAEFTPEEGAPYLNREIDSKQSFSETVPTQEKEGVSSYETT